MKGKLIAIGVLLLIAGVIVYYLLSGSASATDTTDNTKVPTDSGTKTSPTATVQETPTWKPGDPVPDGFYQTVDGRTGDVVIRPISTRS